MSEPLRLEHGNTQVNESQDGDAEQDSVDEAHKRSNAQTSPSIARVAPMIPMTARKSDTTDSMSPVVVTGQWTSDRLE